MKKLKYLKPVLIIILALASFAACKKNFLELSPIGVLSPQTLANGKGVSNLLIGAYSLLDGIGSTGALGSDQSEGASNWLTGSAAAGDEYKGSTPSDGGADALPVTIYTYIASNPFTTTRYIALFAGVSRSNDVLKTILLAKDIPAATAASETAEARFLRGFYYLELRKAYGMIPYYDENTTDANQANTVEIWPKIEADFTYALNNLPATQPNKGRVNKWGAMAYLAKTYMFEHKFDAALPLFHQLISSGVTSSGEKYALSPIYQTNFSPEVNQKNGAESVFASQSSVNDGTQGSNGDQGDQLNFPYGGGPGGCCGWGNPSQWLANSFKTDANGLPLVSTFNQGGDVSNPVNGPVWKGNIDPRIDLTMGRPGVPYLDWGNPQASWIRDPTDGVFNPRKNVYSKSEQGIYSDNTAGSWTASLNVAVNINLMRYSDVLLMAAECEIEASAGDANAALTDVNMIRNRAANPAGWVYKNSAYSPATSTYAITSTPADNYVVSPYPSGAFGNKSFARSAIRFERKIELGMEGMRWFDLQRWDGASVSDPIKTSDGSMAAEINAFFANDVKINSQLQGAHFTANKNEYYAIPQSEIDRSASLGTPKLVQNHGY